MPNGKDSESQRESEVRAFFEASNLAVNRDGFENWLTTILLDEFGNHCSPLIRTTFHSIYGKDICEVSVQASSKPSYVQEGNGHVLYLRIGNSTRRLDAREAIEYAQKRWGGTQ